MSNNGYNRIRKELISNHKLKDLPSKYAIQKSQPKVIGNVVKPADLYNAADNEVKSSHIEDLAVDALTLVHLQEAEAIEISENHRSLSKNYVATLEGDLQQYIDIMLEKYHRNKVNFTKGKMLF